MANFLEQLGIRELSPLVPISLKEFSEHELDVFVKQDYLLHPAYGGNKWRKLKYNIEAYYKGNYKAIWTFGGIYSNHIHALAGICNALSIPCHGILRDSRKSSDLSPTLAYAKSQGMQIHFVSRTAYRQKELLMEQLIPQGTGHMVIPEGGSNALALKGVAEIIDELNEQLEEPVDYLICPAGSGGTAAGLLSGMLGQTKLLVFPALKGDWMRKNIMELLPATEVAERLSISSDYHFGGFARYDNQLIKFMKDWYEKTGIALDPLYNAKSFYGLMEMVRQGKFAKGSKIVLIHTGGLQGIAGFNQSNALQLPEG